MQPQKVVFSAITTTPFQQNENSLENLDNLAKNCPHISFYIGGNGVWDYITIIKPQFMTISYLVDDIIE